MYLSGPGGDGKLYTNGIYAYQGTSAGQIRDNTSESVIDLVNAIDASALLEVKIEFWYRGHGMENGEDFWL